MSTCDESPQKPPMDSAGPGVPQGAPDSPDLSGSPGSPNVSVPGAPSVDLGVIAAELRECLDDLRSLAKLTSGKLLVVGASSSEIIGKKIGSSTSLEVGQVVVRTILDFVEEVGCDVAFQCCEHLNRAIVVPSQVAEKYNLSQVSAIPVPGAGGAVAARAYASLHQAVLVESIQGDAGIDIGDTFIGMHLRRVVVPVRGRRNSVGEAHVTMATTRPPLIGGARAVYDADVARQRLGG